MFASGGETSLLEVFGGERTGYSVVELEGFT